MLALALVPVAEAVAAVLVPVGVLEGVITEGRLLVAVAVSDEVDEVEIEVAEVEVEDDEDTGLSLMMKYELMNGSPKL